MIDLFVYKALTIHLLWNTPDGVFFKGIRFYKNYPSFRYGLNQKDLNCLFKTPKINDPSIVAV